ncbi:MAG: PASTA domain-containing protein [Gemmatimonadetes bacterium]|nr:PASTA domain-containing protein [Gemmatimonadota bacterium]
MNLGSSIRRRRRSLGAEPAGDPVDLGALGRKLGGVGGALIGGVGIGYLVAITVFFPPPEPPPGLQGVPDLRGVGFEDAVRVLADSGLVLARVDSVRHPYVDSGVVLGQRPLPGPTALPDAEVRITMSLGPEVRPVPDVTRMRGDRASLVLAASGFAVSVDTVDSRTPAGRVVSLDPAPETRLPLPGNVVLRVSRGPPPFPMPNVMGLDEEDARRTLTALGLVISEVDTRLSLRNPGEVLDQSPLPDSIVELGSAVRLTVGQSIRRRRR